MVTSIKIDDTLRDRVRRHADLRRRSAHWIMRGAITQYVEGEEAGECFTQEATASWASYQETGLHLTGDEVSAWLRTWGTEAETDPPECHEVSSPKVQGLAGTGAVGF